MYVVGEECGIKFKVVEPLTNRGELINDEERGGELSLRTATGLRSPPPEMV